MFQKEHADRMSARGEVKPKKQSPKALSAQNGNGRANNGGNNKKNWSSKKSSGRPCMNCGSKDHQSNNPLCPEYEKYVKFLVKRRNDYLASAQGGDSESTVKAKKAEVLLAKSKYEKQLHELNELKNQGGRSRSAHLLMTRTRSSSVSSPPSGFVYESPYDLNNMAARYTIWVSANSQSQYLKISARVSRTHQLHSWREQISSQTNRRMIKKFWKKKILIQLRSKVPLAA